jgi:hypothetical protein
LDARLHLAGSPVFAWAGAWVGNESETQVFQRFGEQCKAYRVDFDRAVDTMLSWVLTVPKGQTVLLDF